MITEILMCQCEEKECKYDFISASNDNLDCPSCGSENITGVWRKAVIFTETPIGDISKCSQLDTIIASGAEDIEFNMKMVLDLKECLISWFNEHKILIPDSVSFKMGTHFDYSEDGDEYLDDVLFEGSENLSDEDSIELCEFVDGLYSPSQLNDIESIVLIY